MAEEKRKNSSHLEIIQGNKGRVDRNRYPHLSHCYCLNFSHGPVTIHLPQSNPLHIIDFFAWTNLISNYSKKKHLTSSGVVLISEAEENLSIQKTSWGATVSIFPLLSLFLTLDSPAKPVLPFVHVPYPYRIFWMRRGILVKDQIFNSMYTMSNLRLNS